MCDAGIDINTITSIRLGAQGLAEEKQIQKKILSSFVFVNLRGKVCFCYFAYARATSEDEALEIRPKRDGQTTFRKILQMNII